MSTATAQTAGPPPVRGRVHQLARLPRHLLETRYENLCTELGGRSYACQSWHLSRDRLILLICDLEERRATHDLADPQRP